MDKWANNVVEHPYLRMDATSWTLLPSDIAGFCHKKVEFVETGSRRVPLFQELWSRYLYISEAQSHLKSLLCTHTI